MTGLVLMPALAPEAAVWILATLAAIGGAILHAAHPPRDPAVAEALLHAAVHP